MKALEKEQAVVVCFKVDHEGLAYAAMNGYMDDLYDTEHDSVIKKFRAAADELEIALETIRDKFEIELQKHEKQATKEGLPFARHVAREEFNAAIKSQIDKQLREYGSIEKPEELKLPIMEWTKYSNLKNFDLIEEHEQPDSHLTKHNPGLSVACLCTTYKFKGYSQTFKVMESGPDAILRAIKNRAKLDKVISKELG